MTYTDYSRLSAKTLLKISGYQNSIQEAIERDSIAQLFSDFENDVFGKTVYGFSEFMYSTPYVSVTVDSGDTAKQVLKWFSGKDYRYATHEDVTNWRSYREYKLECRSDESKSIELRIAFSGTCEFVEEPTGEFEDVPEVIGVPAHRRQVMKKVLTCGDDVVPASSV